MKVTILTLLLVGLALCSPRGHGTKKIKKRNLIGGNNGINALNPHDPSPIGGLFGNIANVLNYSPLEAAQCKNEFGSLDASKLIKLQNQQLYYFPVISTTYYEAKAYCDSKGMKIVVLETLAESVLLAEQLSKFYKDDDEYSYSWIGLRANPPGSGFYKWEYTNAPLMYGNWESNSEPDISSDCVTFDVTDYLAYTGWNTESCTNENPFVCELPARCNRYLNAATAIFDNL